MKWTITSKRTGLILGTFEAPDREGALEALAVVLAHESNCDIAKARERVKLGGDYTIEEEPPPRAVGPTLFGLTFDQLEGLRGYVECIAALEHLRRMHLEFAESESPAYDKEILPRHAETRASVIGVSAATPPFGEGARFALAVRQEQWEQVRQTPTRKPA